MKNYYQILGVIEDAEEIVIRAAYKALAQKYHPDKWNGSNEEANIKMASINEAYGVLSDPEARKKYDQELFKKHDPRDSSTFSDPGESEQPNEADEAWDMAISFFPGLTASYIFLKKISPRLANTFKFDISESKKFNDYENIKNLYADRYLIKFYGENGDIRNLAKQLLLNDFQDDAIKLNRMVRLMGASISFEQVTERLLSENTRLTISKNPKENSIKAVRAKIDTIYRQKARKTLANGEVNRSQLKKYGEEFLGIRIEVSEGFISNWFRFEFKGEKYKLNDLDMTKFLINKI